MNLQFGLNSCIGWRSNLSQPDVLIAPQHSIKNSKGQTPPSEVAAAFKKQGLAGMLESDGLCAAPIYLHRELVASRGDFKAFLLTVPDLSNDLAIEQDLVRSEPICKA